MQYLQIIMFLFVAVLLGCSNPNETLVEETFLSDPDVKLYVEAQNNKLRIHREIDRELFDKEVRKLYSNGSDGNVCAASEQKDFSKIDASVQAWFEASCAAYTIREQLKERYNISSQQEIATLLTKARMRYATVIPSSIRK